MSLLATLILLCHTLGQQLQAPSEVIEMLEKSRDTAFPENYVPIPLRAEESRLDQMFNSRAREVNRIMSSPELDSSDKTAALRALRASPPEESDTDYLVAKCREAIADEPPDWKMLQRCFFIGESGHSDGRLILVAESLVLFQNVDHSNVSTEQICTTLAAINMLARLDWAGRVQFMQKCANGTAWHRVELESPARPDLARLLQNQSILALAALPSVEADGILDELTQRYPPDQVVGNRQDATLAMSVAIVKKDFERQARGLPPILEGIR